MKISDKHSTVLNLTARLAVSIQNLPDEDFDWNDSTPSHISLHRPQKCNSLGKWAANQLALEAMAASLPGDWL